MHFQELEEARLRIELRRTEAALKILLGVISSSPDNAHAHYLAGLCHLYAQNAEAALEEAEQCIALVPEDPSGYMILANAHLFLSDPGDTISHYEPLRSHKAGQVLLALCLC